MNFTRMFVVAAACALSMGPAFAQDAPDTAKGKPAKEKKLCRREVSTGSIMPHMTCHTQTEWEQIEAARTRDTEQSLRRSGTAGRN